jgi:hypothetical protein
VRMDEAADCEEVCMGNNFLVVIICFLKLVASSCSAHWHEEQYHKASLCSSHGRRQRNFGVPKKLVPVLNLYITKLPRRMREEHPEAQQDLQDSGSTLLCGGLTHFALSSNCCQRKTGQLHSSQ